MATARPVGSITRYLVLTGLVLVFVAAGCSSDSDGEVASGPGENGWQPFHDFGRWALDIDRQTVRVERGGLICNERRVVVLDQGADEWLVRFELQRTGDPCPAVACSRGSCLEMTLESPVPDGVRVRAVCDPAASFYATTAPGGAQATLGPTPDAVEPVVCSAEPETDRAATSVGPRPSPSRDITPIELAADPERDGTLGRRSRHDDRRSGAAIHRAGVPACMFQW